MRVLALALLISLSIPSFVSAASLTRSLSIGNSGADVEVLQQILKDSGFFTYPTITGYFGAATQNAVIAFQKAHGIDPIGIVGPLTRAALMNPPQPSPPPASQSQSTPSTSLATTTVSTKSMYDSNVTLTSVPGGTILQSRKGARTAEASPTYTIGGTVSGLGGGTLVLRLNGGSDLSITSNGAFVFGTSLSSDASYVVTVHTQPLNHTCSVTNGTGTVTTANINNIAITCLSES